MKGVCEAVSTRHRGRRLINMIIADGRRNGDSKSRADAAPQLATHATQFGALAYACCEFCDKVCVQQTHGALSRNAVVMERCIRRRTRLRIDCGDERRRVDAGGLALMRGSTVVSVGHDRATREGATHVSTEVC